MCFIGKLSLGIVEPRESGLRFSMKAAIASFASATAAAREQAGFLGHLLCDLRRDRPLHQLLGQAHDSGGNAASAAAERARVRAGFPPARSR